MAVTLSPVGGAAAQFFDDSGNPLTGGKLYTYLAGTTTPQPTYTSVSGVTACSNPIVLDAAGRVPGGEIWLSTGVGYKFVTKTSTDVLIATYDNIPSSAQPPAANDASAIMYEPGYVVNAGSFVVGDTYRIASIGTTDFTLIGATTNLVGLHFIATGVGSGTGTAEYSRTVQSKLRETLSVKDFGAVGDGVTDDTLAIQAAIDYALHTGMGLVTIPSGTYIVSNTLNLGYGVSGTTLVLEGYAGYEHVSGSTIKSTFQDRPIINIQGGRRSGVRNLVIRGPYEFTNPWGSDQKDIIGASDPANYVLPAWKDTQNAPFCCVCIDGYSGTAPANPYPTPTYPSWIPTPASAYGKSTSSDCFVERCYVQWATVGICVQPNSDGNGDFMHFTNTDFLGHKVGVSFGNVNARANDYTNCIFDYCYTFIDTLTYYKTNRGNFAGNLSNIHGNQSWRVFNVALNWATPSACVNFYNENMGQLGHFEGSPGSSPMGFLGCNFQFRDFTSTGNTIVQENVTNITDISGQPLLDFNSCTFELRRAWFPFGAAHTFKNCTFTPTVQYNNNFYRSLSEELATLDVINTVIPASIKLDSCNVRTTYDGGSMQPYSSIDNKFVTGIHSVMAQDAGDFGDYAYITSNSSVIGVDSALLNGTRTTNDRGFTVTTTNTMYQIADVIKLDVEWYFLESITDLGGGSYQHQWNRLTNYTYSSGTYTLGGDNTGNVHYLPYGMFDTRWLRDVSLPLVTVNRYFKTTAGSANVTYVDSALNPISVPFSTTRKILHFGENAITGWFPVIPFHTPYPLINSISTSTLTMNQNAVISGLWLDAPGYCLIKLL